MILLRWGSRNWKDYIYSATERCVWRFYLRSLWLRLCRTIHTTKNITWPSFVPFALWSSGRDRELMLSTHAVQPRLFYRPKFHFQFPEARSLLVLLYCLSTSMLVSQDTVDGLILILDGRIWSNTSLTSMERWQVHFVPKSVNSMEQHSAMSFDLMRSLRAWLFNTGNRRKVI
jgi:hypothetical protein